MNILDRPARHIFFTGKGGVGKTSASSAIAVALADAGKSVLLVSTDPASNLDEVFGVRLCSKPTPIPGVERLLALNVDPEAAAAEYRERVVGPYRNLLPAAAVASIEEQLAGACTVEIAAFDEFAKLIADSALTSAFDHIVFDTAPTGHTLRLLSLPAAWTGFIDASTAGTSCLGPLQGLVDQRELYAAALGALSDPVSTTLVLVSRPERASLAEAARSSRELAELGIRNQVFILNGVFKATDRSDPIALAMERKCAEAMASMPAQVAAFERMVVPLKPGQVLGVDALRRFLGGETLSQPAAAAPVRDAHDKLPGLDQLIDDLALDSHGLIMTMGKGGVGKTTLAARIAVGLAQRGRKVHLTTTDPAAHVASAVDGAPRNLTIGEVNPAVEVAHYRAEVMATTGANLDANGRALLLEDLSSPCTEEIAVFQAFARTVDQAKDQFVVVDTAPTGHTILLLDAAQAFHREVMRQAKSVTDSVLSLLPRLRDPRYTKIFLCTLPEATPVHEAAALQDDLRRAQIEPHGWFINQSLTPLAVRDPVLVARRNQEARYIEEVLNVHSHQTFIEPWRDVVSTGRNPAPMEAVELA